MNRAGQWAYYGKVRGALTTGNDAGGQHNAWATRNTEFMTRNMLHIARILKSAGGIPASGNSTNDWDLTRAAHPNPE